jgi:hypothetical protein
MSNGHLYWYELDAWLSSYLGNSYVDIKKCPEDPLAESSSYPTQWHSYVLNASQFFAGSDGSSWGRRLNKSGYIFMTDYNWDITTGIVGPGTFSTGSSYIIRFGTVHGGISGNILFDDTHVSSMTFDEILTSDKMTID